MMLKCIKNLVLKGLGIKRSASSEAIEKVKCSSEVSAGEVSVELSLSNSDTVATAVEDEDGDCIKMLLELNNYVAEIDEFEPNPIHSPSLNQENYMIMTGKFSLDYCDDDSLDGNHIPLNSQ